MCLYMLFGVFIFVKWIVFIIKLIREGILKYVVKLRNMKKIVVYRNVN